MGLFDKNKKQQPNKKKILSEFEKDIHELIDRPDIQSRPEICSEEYKKAISLLKTPTQENIHRAYDIMGQLAAAFNYVPAIMWMGDFVENALNDNQQAAIWYKRAADLGDGNGCRCYADMLITGKGIPSNRDLAMKYYIKASDLGVPEASFVVGEHYRSQGNKEDAIKAYRKAAAGGYEPANKRIEQLQKNAVEDQKTNPISKSVTNTVSPEIQFYIDCVEDYHQTAKQHGFAKDGVVFIKELRPIGEKVVLAFLRDPFFQSEFGSNPQLYYYAIMSLSLQAGMVIAEKWDSTSVVDEAYVERIIKEGPADTCKPLLKKLGLTDNEKENSFYQVIFGRWLAKHEPYWKMQDPREYTYMATLAAYQLGISMILDHK